jgi:hypothetical protein
MASKHHTTQCPICKKECRGVYAHVQISHPEAFARLAEDTERLASNRNFDDLLAEKESEIASLREKLEAKRTSIADFPPAEQAAYFVQFVQSLSDDEKATLAEELRQTADLPQTQHDSKLIADLSQNVEKADSDLKQNADLPPVVQTEANRKKTILIIGNRRFAVVSR